MEEKVKEHRDGFFVFSLHSPVYFVSSLLLSASWRAQSLMFVLGRACKPKYKIPTARSMPV